MDAEHALLANIHHHLPELDALLAEVQDPLTYEERLYRFYYQSWKVYELQGLTREIARLMAAIAPEGHLFCAAFQELLDAGAGEVRFEAAHNQAWTQHTRIFVEAFLHAKFHIPSDFVVECVTAQRKPPEVRIWTLRNQSAVGTRPPSTSTPH
jgi:hypothetical protein